LSSRKNRNRGAKNYRKLCPCDGTITCWNCSTKFSVKRGTKNDSRPRVVICPNPDCKQPNKFKIDGKGRIRAERKKQNGTQLTSQFPTASL
jgi:hypothetical protein